MIDDLGFYVLFKSISVILGQWTCDNDKLCTIQPLLQFKNCRHRYSNMGPLDQLLALNPLTYRGSNIARHRNAPLSNVTTHPSSNRENCCSPATRNSTNQLRGWSGGVMVLGKLPVPGRPSHLDKSRARVYCACSR